ncbi:carbon storage regulator [Tepidibacter hydrothermalis]|uniref:Carbon storage regulator n=1 Tax=Tepidibacter hydrothermalis TaxID=3036126 RepID=A0ABY8E6X6_9FIRM|nr:carbon storage regulator [Tepidibacter hydrothermalis]WFD08646.1 carbon storage regulator [Tepidibacter hydrothermalis]
MLVLGIKTGETITIGDNVKITFVKVKENTTRVAIDAPREVTILREGVENKKQAVND